MFPTGYQMPVKVLADLADAPQTPAVSIDPTNRWMIILERPGLFPISDLAQPELKLAGVRINPKTNGPSRDYTFPDMSLQEIKSGRKHHISLPGEQIKINDFAWSPDGSYLAFSLTVEQGVELWLLETATAKVKKLTGPILNAALGRTFNWISNTKSLIIRTVPPDRGPVPATPLLPDGPLIQENIGKTAPARTYADLLKNPHDEDLFEYYATSQAAIVNLKGEITFLNDKDIIDNLKPSPDGRYYLEEKIIRPFSYLLPYYRFPRQVEIRDMAGRLIKTLASLPLQDQIPITRGAVQIGPRDFGWRADVPSAVTWAEAQDGGDPRVEAKIRDKIFQSTAPFETSPRVLASLELRYNTTAWGNDSLALVSEWWWPNRQYRTWVINPSQPDREPKLLWDISFEDRYNDPGSPVTVINKNGEEVLYLDKEGESLYLIGDGASPEGDRPFLDKLELKTGKTQRLFHSRAPYYERPVRLVNDREIITRKESPKEPPNYFYKQIGGKSGRALTKFPHPTPALLGIQKQLIRYRRSDSLELTATLYLPKSYKAKKDGPLPMVMWAYPQDFVSASAAGQVTDSPYRFIRIASWSPLLWLTRGYAVLDNPSMPIVSKDSLKPNDSYIPQLIADAQAAVDEVVRLEVADRERIAIGGHSYGAFMTANLLAHTRLFRAGIAETGAYNRTLTPFGFQAEDRTMWEAPEVYINMSPIMQAHKIKDPILVIHGQADDNSGTFPIQSERFYEALKGNGAPARLVMLPLEDHFYQSRESALHVLWEKDQWLERWVKNYRKNDIEKK